MTIVQWVSWTGKVAGVKRMAKKERRVEGSSKKLECGDVNARVHVWSAAVEGVSDGQISGGGAPEGGVLLLPSSLSSSHALAPLEIGGEQLRLKA